MEKIHRYKLEVKEHHLDTFGHVNNSKVLQILEEARWDLITENGYGLKEVQASGFGPTILEINIQFKKELLLRQPLTVETIAVAYKRSLFEFQQQIKNEASELCVQAIFRSGLLDLEKRKLVRPTPEWLKGIGIEPSELDG